MNKIFYIPLIALFAFTLSACNPKTSPTSDSAQGTLEEQSLKMAQIIESGDSAKCVITDLESQTSTDYYIMGNKMKVTSLGLQESSFGTMINDGTYTYVWQDGETTGFKSKLPTEEEIADMEKDLNDLQERAEEYQTPSDLEEYDNNENYRVDCQKVKLTDADFTPPSDIQFIDPMEMVPSELGDFDLESMMNQSDLE